MTATAHAIIGTVIASKIGNPALAIPLAVASHIIADLIPHWDSGTNKHKKTNRRFLYESIADVALGWVLSFFLLVFFFPETNLLYAYIIITAAQLPDWLHSFYVYLDWKYPPFIWFYKISKATNKKLDKPWGIILQIWVVLLLLGYAIFS